MQQNDTATPGTLAGISYHYSTTFMGAEFSITLSTEAIKEANYWPSLDEGRITKANVPITKAQWEEVERRVLRLYPLLKPMPENGPDPWVTTWMDRPIFDLTLLWRTEWGIQKIRYYRPDSRHFEKLILHLATLAKTQQTPPQPDWAPAPMGWACGCGQRGNTGNFCPNCGSKKPAPKPSWKCPQCGTMARGQYCPECAAKKPDGPLPHACSQCGWEPANPAQPPKFCPARGNPFEKEEL